MSDHQLQLSEASDKIGKHLVLGWRCASFLQVVIQLVSFRNSNRSLRF